MSSEFLAARTPWQMRLDIAWARALLWFAGAGREADPRRDVHLFLGELYARLGTHHAGRGSMVKAKRLWDRAERHYDAAASSRPY